MALEDKASLLEALFLYDKSDILDYPTKAALRLCNKHFKNLVDATVIVAKIKSSTLTDDLNALINTGWTDLKALVIDGVEEEEYPDPMIELPSALFTKFSRLELLRISACFYLESLPTEIGELSELTWLQICYCTSLEAFPPSVRHLTALAHVDVSECDNLTAQGLAPLQHLTTRITQLSLGCRARNDNMIKYTSVVCKLTSLQSLLLCSISIKTLPSALGNLTSLETLVLCLSGIKKLPDSIGNLNALTTLGLVSCLRLTALPESLDDLLWRKAHEKGESGMMRYVAFVLSPKLVLSAKMEQALELLKERGMKFASGDLPVRI